MINIKLIRDIFNNLAIIGIIITLISSFLTYLKTWLISSSLTTSDFGLYIYISTILGWIVTIATSGLNNGLLCHLINSGERHNFYKIVSWVLSLSFKRGFLGIIAASIAYIFLLNPQSNDAIFLYFSIALLIPLSVASYSLNSVLIYKGRLILNNISSSFILNGGAVIFLALFYHFGINYYILSLSVIIPSIVNYLFLTKFTNCIPSIHNLDGFNSEKKSIISGANHMLFSGILYAFWIKAESFFLNHGCGSSCVARFYIPYQFASLLAIVNTVLYGVISSKLSESINNFKIQEYFFYEVSLFGFFLNFIGFLFIYINSSELLLIFGPEYSSEDAIIVIKLLSTAFLFYSYYGSTSEVFLNMLGKHKYLLISSMITVVISIFLNVFITMNYDAIGAAFSLSITMICTSLFRLFFVNRQLKFKLKNKFFISLYIFISILVMELIISISNKFEFYNKVLINNILLFLFLFLFVIFYQKRIRSNLKNIGFLRKFN